MVELKLALDHDADKTESIKCLLNE